MSGFWVTLRGWFAMHELDGPEDQRCISWTGYPRASHTEGLCDPREDLGSGDAHDGLLAASRRFCILWKFCAYVKHSHGLFDLAEAILNATTGVYTANILPRGSSQLDGIRLLEKVQICRVQNNIH